MSGVDQFGHHCFNIGSVDHCSVFTESAYLM